MESEVPDVVGPNLRILFIGINPGLRSAAAGRHFANPRNDFWRLLFDSGLLSEQLGPADQDRLPSLGLGITNAALRTTPGSGDLRAADFLGGRERLTRLVEATRPAVIAFVGKEAYRGLFREGVALGPAMRSIGAARAFVLPSTSPANAAVGYAERLRWFRALSDFASR